ncbi:hypothetical protein evm_011415 [Chilo suppressalis]|nr:hypothetical protein evm_011415 [Chilo suppressalis]
MRLMQCAVKEKVQRYLHLFTSYACYLHYGSMNVSALKVELRKRGAKLNGLKEQLIQRLQDYDRNNNFVAKNRYFAVAKPP